MSTVKKYTCIGSPGSFLGYILPSSSQCVSELLPVLPTPVSPIPVLPTLDQEVAFCLLLKKLILGIKATSWSRLVFEDVFGSCQSDILCYRLALSVRTIVECSYQYTFWYSQRMWNHMLYKSICEQIVKSIFESTQLHNFMYRFGKTLFRHTMLDTLYKWPYGTKMLWSCVHSKIDLTVRSWIPLYNVTAQPWAKRSVVRDSDDHKLKMWNHWLSCGRYI